VGGQGEETQEVSAVLVNELGEDMWEINSHRDGITNTGSRDYEQAQREIERRQYARMARGDSSVNLSDSNDGSIHKAMERVGTCKTVPTK
jgi:hypothetical protein